MGRGRVKYFVAADMLCDSPALLFSHGSGKDLLGEEMLRVSFNIEAKKEELPKQRLKHQISPRIDLIYVAFARMHDRDREG